jgi:hypothetical protein
MTAGATSGVRSNHGLLELRSEHGQHGKAEVVVRQRGQDGIPAGRGEGALGGSDGLVMLAHKAKLDGQKAPDLSEPPQVVEGRREPLGLV